MTTIEIPDPLLGAVRRAAAAEGTSVPSLIERALRAHLGERVVRPDATRVPGGAPPSADARPYGRMQEVFDSYVMEGLVAPADDH